MIASKIEKFLQIASECQINMKDNFMAHLFKQIVEDLKATIPVLTCLRDSSLEDSHWEEIFSILDTTIDLEDENFTLNSLLMLNVMEFKESLEEISMRAKNEKRTRD
jgi:hypothetical protein